MEADAGYVPGHGVRRGRDDPGVAMRQKRKAAGSEMFQVRSRILRAMGTPCPRERCAAKHGILFNPSTAFIPLLISKNPMCRRITRYAAGRKRDDGKFSLQLPFVTRSEPFRRWCCGR